MEKKKTKSPELGMWCLQITQKIKPRFRLNSVCDLFVEEDRPGIVTVVQGVRVECQPTRETTYTASGYGTFPENEDTVHWVHNRTDAFTTALVCDIAMVQ